MTVTSKNPKQNVLKEEKGYGLVFRGVWYYLLVYLEMCNIESRSWCKSFVTQEALYSLKHQEQVFARRIILVKNVIVLLCFYLSSKNQVRYTHEHLNPHTNE